MVYRCQHSSHTRVDTMESVSVAAARPTPLCMVVTGGGRPVCARGGSDTRAEPPVRQPGEGELGSARPRQPPQPGSSSRS